MIRERVSQVKGVALWLSIVASYIDGIGLAGILSTRSMTAALVDRSSPNADLFWLAVLCVGYLAMFVCGVTAGSLIRQTSPSTRQRQSVLIFAALLVALAAVFLATGQSQLTFLAVAAAIGTLNATAESSDSIRFGLIFTPATLTRLGQCIVYIKRGDSNPWIAQVLIFVTSAVGAAGGVAASTHFGATGLIFAIAAIAIMTIPAGAKPSNNGGS